MANTNEYIDSISLLQYEQSISTCLEVMRKNNMKRMRLQKRFSFLKVALDQEQFVVLELHCLTKKLSCCDLQPDG